MKEFIVWDEDNKVFIDETKCILQDGTLYRNHRDFEDGISDDLTMVNYIGKTDDTPEQNKIYADCSILEWIEINYLGRRHSMTTGEVTRINPKEVKRRGYFTFSKYDLSYAIIQLEDGEESPALNYNTTYSNFKVIGTLQQNPELLETNES